MKKSQINPRPSTKVGLAAGSKSGGGLKSFTPGAGHSMKTPKGGK